MEDCSPTTTTSRQITLPKVLGWVLLVGCAQLVVFGRYTMNTSRTLQQQFGQSLSSSSHAPPLLQQIAPMIFPMDPEDTTKIQFPSQVRHVVIDIGARNSDYLQTLEQQLDPTIALILVDPLPESIIPLASRAAIYNMKHTIVNNPNPLNYYPDATYGDRVFVVRGGMGQTEQARVQFQMGGKPECGSLLKTAQGNNFECWGTTKQLVVSVFTLESLLDMIPETDQIQSVHVKIDTEGADHLVLEGAGAALDRLSSIIIECAPPPNATDVLVVKREGMCQEDKVMQWMCDERDFCGQSLKPQGGLSNIFFWKDDQSIVVPSFLTQATIQFQSWYVELTKRLNDKKIRSSSSSNSDNNSNKMKRKRNKKGKKKLSQA